MKDRLPILSDAQRAGLRPELTDVIEYRKSGLSLNHVIDVRWTAHTVCGTCSTTTR